MLTDKIYKINGVVANDSYDHTCCVCGNSIWGGQMVGYPDDYDIETAPKEWLMTCGEPKCQEMLQLNPMAYEL